MAIEKTDTEVAINDLFFCCNLVFFNTIGIFYIKCSKELSGKVCVDYKNELALRALTRTLLLEYFQLSIDFAPGSLIPTLPLRLNYILWLEDLMEENAPETVKGIDIGRSNK